MGFLQDVATGRVGAMSEQWAQEMGGHQRPITCASQEGLRGLTFDIPSLELKNGYIGM